MYFRKMQFLGVLRPFRQRSLHYLPIGLLLDCCCNFLATPLALMMYFMINSMYSRLVVDPPDDREGVFITFLVVEAGTCPLSVRRQGWRKLVGLGFGAG